MRLESKVARPPLTGLALLVALCLLCPRLATAAPASRDELPPEVAASIAKTEAETVEAVLAATKDVPLNPFMIPSPRVQQQQQQQPARTTTPDPMLDLLEQVYVALGRQNNAEPPIVSSGNSIDRMIRFGVVDPPNSWRTQSHLAAMDRCGPMIQQDAQQTTFITCGHKLEHLLEQARQQKLESQRAAEEEAKRAAIEARNRQIKLERRILRLNGT